VRLPTLSACSAVFLSADSCSAKRGYAGARGVKEAQGPLLRGAEADPAAHSERPSPSPPRRDDEITSAQICVVAAQIDRHSTAEIAGSASEGLDRNVAATAALHSFDSRDWVESSDEDGRADACRFGRNVQTIMHAVYEVDVGMTGSPKKRRGAFRWASITMACWVDERQVCFGLDDAA